MTVSTQPSITEAPVIHPATRLGHVHYTVANLDNQIAFYRDILGFKLHWREGNAAGMGAGKEDLLRLTQVDGTREVQGTTGLYHTAFLVPTRLELAQLLRSIAITRTPIQGMSDHGTHHAIYLPDAEGNGIELAWDRPKEMWPKTLEEMIRNNRGLSPDTVFSVLTEDDAEWQGLDAGTIVGHVHLHVSSLKPTNHFYHEVLGFGLPFDMTKAPRQFADTAIFFSAGGYHHHIGTNIWQGEGAPPPPKDATGLRYFTAVLPDSDELERVRARLNEANVPAEQTENGLLIRDPAQNGLMLAVEGL
ncbi:MAG: VOC family protein [Anaerolineae bacterium]